MLPTVTLPKLKLVGFDPSVPGVTPVPDKGMVRVGFDAVDVTVRLPLAFPADCGVKVTVKFVLWPAISVTGAVIPPKLNPVPLTPICEIVTLEAPVLVNVSESVWLLPNVTLPKPRLLGLELSAPGATPVPVTGTVRVGLDAVDVMVMLPLATPADAGVNVTLSVALCPAVNVTGAVMPVRVNPAPLIPTCEIVTLDPPVFVTVSERDCLLPTITLPKLRLVGLGLRTPGVTPAPDNGIVKVGLEAFDVIVMLPLALPAVVGVNVALKVALCPAVSVKGAVTPLRENPVPLIPT